MELSLGKIDSHRKANRRRDLPRTHESWEIEQLSDLARRGSLAAGRELIQRAIDQCARASTRRPDLIAPDLCGWLKEFLDAAFENPRQSLSELIAPPRPRLRAMSHAELVLDLTLSEEVYARVRMKTSAGVSRKDVFTAVAEELNELGYRNAHNKPLKAGTIQHRFYDMSRRKRAASAY